MTQPLIPFPVRVIVPAYKANATIHICLQHIFKALTSFADAEVFVVTHKTTIRNFSDDRLHIIDSAKPLNAGEARNVGAQDCGNRILLFVDADVLVHADTFVALTAPIRQGIADATVGNYATDVYGNAFYQKYKKLYIHQAYAREGFITNEFWTAIAAIHGNVFHAVGAFSTTFAFKGGEDTEIGMRITNSGFRIYAVATAQGSHLKTFTFSSLVENDFIKGTRTVVLALQRKTPLSENRHAKKSDQHAVALACLMLILIPAASLVPWLILFMPLLVAGYIYSRGSFVILCIREGMWFTIRALIMSWTLDLVRAASVAFGSGIYFLRKAPAVKAPASAVVTLQPGQEPLRA